VKVAPVTILCQVVMQVLAPTSKFYHIILDPLSNF
jgi:hypothetical protein